MSDIVYLIHGMWGGPWYWENYRRVFESRGLRCVAATLPLHEPAADGGPPPQLGRLGLIDYVDALEREIDALDTRPVLVGHSMGGLLAQMLAARGRARAAVLLTPASPAGIRALTPSVLRCFLPSMLRWGFWRRPMRPSFATAVYAMLHRLSPAMQREVYARMVPESGRAAAEIGLWPLDPNRASRVDADAVRCPLLVIAGSEDRITPASVVRKVATRYGEQATFRVYPQHAHWVVAEPGWEAIAHCSADWIGRLPPAG